MTPRSRLLVTGHSVASQALSGCSSAERYHCGFVVRRALSCPCLFRRHPLCAVFVVLISFSSRTICRGRLLLGGRGSPDILISDGTLLGKSVIPEDTSTHASAPMDLFDAWSTNCSVLALLLGFDPDCVAIVSSFCPDILRYTRQGRSDAFLLERSLAASSALLSGHNFAPSWSAGTLTTVIEASAA